jgi:hypothetical protein
VVVAVTLLAIYQHILRAAFTVAISTQVACHVMDVVPIITSTTNCSFLLCTVITEDDLLAVIPDLRAVVDVLPFIARVAEAVVVEPFLCTLSAKSKLVAILIDSAPVRRLVELHPAIIISSNLTSAGSQALTAKARKTLCSTCVHYYLQLCAADSTMLVKALRGRVELLIVIVIRVR